MSMFQSDVWCTIENSRFFWSSSYGQKKVDHIVLDKLKDIFKLEFIEVMYIGKVEFPNFLFFSFRTHNFSPKWQNQS
jgi:hypothetical protein